MTPMRRAHLAACDFRIHPSDCETLGESERDEGTSHSLRRIPGPDVTGTLFLDDFLVLLGDLLPEVGVHLFVPLLLAGDLGIVDIADLDVIEGADAGRELDRLLRVGAGRSLHFVLGGDGVEAATP